MKSGRPKGPAYTGSTFRYFLAALFGASLAAHVCAPPAEAGSGLSVQARVQQEFYEPLIPMSRNFKTCFKTDSKGVQVMSICTDNSQPAPSAEPTLTPLRSPATQQKSQTPQRSSGAAGGGKAPK